MSTNEDKHEEKDEYNQEVKDLVIARLTTIPSNISMSIGDKGEFDIAELINRVEECDEIGKKVIEMQLSYIRSFQKEYSKGS